MSRADKIARRKSTQSEKREAENTMWEITVPTPAVIDFRVGQSRIVNEEWVDITKAMTFGRFFIDNLMTSGDIWGKKVDDIGRCLKLAAKLDHEFEGGEKILLTDEEFRKANKQAMDGPWAPHAAMQIYPFIQAVREYHETENPSGARRVPIVKKED